MKVFLNKLGYALILVGFIAMNYKYGSYLLYESTYLIFGEQQELRVENKNNIEGKNIYYFRSESSEQKTLYSSIPIKRNIQLDELVQVRTVPIFNKVFLGPFLLVPFVMGLLLLFFGFFISIISVLMIFDVNNFITQKIR
jgi:hypothetical protein